MYVLVVVSLPMRDGNAQAVKTSAALRGVVSLPMRDGNRDLSLLDAGGDWLLAYL